MSKNNNEWERRRCPSCERIYERKMIPERCELLALNYEYCPYCGFETGLSNAFMVNTRKLAD